MTKVSKIPAARNSTKRRHAGQRKQNKDKKKKKKTRTYIVFPTNNENDALTLALPPPGMYVCRSGFRLGVYRWGLGMCGGVLCLLCSVSRCWQVFVAERVCICALVKILQKGCNGVLFYSVLVFPFIVLNLVCRVFLVFSFLFFSFFYSFCFSCVHYFVFFVFVFSFLFCLFFFLCFPALSAWP